MALLSVSFYQIMLLITVLNIARAPCVLHCFRCTFLEEQRAEPTASKCRTQTLQGRTGNAQAANLHRSSWWIFTPNWCGLFCFVISYRDCEKEKSTDPKGQTETISYQNGNKITLDLIKKKKKG